MITGDVCSSAKEDVAIFELKKHAEIVRGT